MDKKNYPTLTFVQKKHVSDMLAAAYTVRDPQKRNFAVRILKTLLESNN